MSFAPSQGGALASQVLSLGGGTLTGPILAPAGSAAAPSYSFSGDTNTGAYLGAADDIRLCTAGVDRVRIADADLIMAASQVFSWGSSGISSPDVALVRDAAAVLALKNGTTAQEFRVYGTTTGPKYLRVLHDGTDGAVFTN